jgi:hypothetical protein
MKTPRWQSERKAGGGFFICGMVTKILQFTQTGDHRRRGRVQKAKNTLAQHKCESSSVELFCLPTAWSENEKRMQNAVRLKNVRTGFL